MKLTTIEQAQLDMINRGLENGNGEITLEAAPTLHYMVFGKSIGSCPNCAADAITLLMFKRKYLQAKLDSPATVLLRDTLGFELNGQFYNNSNVTEEAVREYLSLHPERKNRFAILPDDLLADGPIDQDKQILEDYSDKEHIVIGEYEVAPYIQDDVLSGKTEETDQSIVEDNGVTEVGKTKSKTAK